MVRAKRWQLPKTHVALLAVFFVLFGAVLVNIGFTTSSTFAATTCVSTRTYCNEPEQAAYTKCSDKVESGAMWFNTSNNAPTDAGYYSAQVNVVDGQNSVTVQLRGSVNSCTIGGQSYTSYATSIAPSGPNAGRLTNLGSSVLSRGKIASSTYQWSAQGSSVSATLNVSGLATNNAGRTDTETITIGIYRCFSTNSQGIGHGACYSTDVPVTVVRSAGAKFALTPSVSTDPTDTVMPGGTITPTGVVTKSGPTSSSDASWQLSTFTIAPGGAVPHASGGKNNQTPKAFFGGNLSVIASGTQKFTTSVTSKPQSAIAVGDPAIGTKFCYVMSVHPYNQSTTDWYHSVVTCLVVGKRPSTQIIGGDLRVGAAFVGNATPAASNISTSVTVKNGTSYGSWGEYGLIASGTVTGAASGSGYNCTTNCAGIKNLTFSNTPTTGGYTSPNMPNIAAAFPITGSTPAFVSISHDAPLNHVTKGSGTITITGGTILKGQWIVINAPTATVNITGDINYQDTALNGINDIPQMVIIANNINISGGVKNIDAWLVASGSSGTITTCSDVANTANLSTALCKNQLTLHGPLLAKTLYLRRTFGADSGNASGTPAEVIDLRPDAYLWGIAQASQSAQLQTISTRELPPRF